MAGDDLDMWAGGGGLWNLHGVQERGHPRGVHGLDPSEPRECPVKKGKLGRGPEAAHRVAEGIFHLCLGLG